MQFKKIFIGSLLVLLCINACKVGKKYQTPELDIPNQVSFSQANDSLTIADVEWYEMFNDTVLINYIELALANNQDVRIAAARIREAMALRRMSEAPLVPSLDLYAESNREQVEGDDLDIEHVARFELSWELDLWGNIRWGREASIAEYFSTVEAHRAVKMALISSVAKAYFELIASKRELEIVKETGRARREGVHIAELRYKGGLTSETSLMQAKVEFAKTMSLIPSVERDISLTRNSLAKLLGQMPQEEMVSLSLYHQKQGAKIPVGMPSYVLKRRPDIKQAEQSLIIANANVGVAYTDMFPKITLTAKYGNESESFEELLKSPYSYLAGSLLAPVFSGGARRAKLKAQKAVLDQALLEYEKVIITAFQETDNAILTFRKAKEIKELRIDLEKSAENYLELAQIQYINGAINYLDLLDAQRFLFDAEVSLNEAVLNELLSYVYLYKTLGGGWNS